jgi:MinD-like ATPase involved in chromosome partitioning or flagellar assembly
MPKRSFPARPDAPGPAGREAARADDRSELPTAGRHSLRADTGTTVGPDSPPAAGHPAEPGSAEPGLPEPGPTQDPPPETRPPDATPGPPAWALAPTHLAPSVRPAEPAPPPAAPPQPAAPAAPSWRRTVRTTGSAWRSSRPPRDAQRRPELIQRTRRPLSRSHQVAVLALKGGVGRTTIAALLGLTLAEHRDDRVVVLDATPAGGTLADRLTGPTDLGIRDLLDRFDEVRTLDDIDRFSGVVGSLRVLASDQDLARNTALNSLDYERVCLLLQRHFPVLITDGATGPALPGTLALAQSVVVVGSLTVDGAGSAGRTLDWLVGQGYRDAAARAVLVLDGDRVSDGIDAARLRAHFASRYRAVVELPHDPHLAQGGRIEAGALAAGTREAALELAALVADEFGMVTAGRR